MKGDYRSVSIKRMLCYLAVFVLLARGIYLLIDYIH